MFREKLAAQFANLSEHQLTQLEDHFKALTLWNKRLNLTRIDGIDESIRFHYYESLLLGTALPPGPLKVADVGSGAGFPGIPIAILRPEISMTLIESHRRKAVFLSEASRNLSNVSVIASRAESSEWTGDWIVSRAVNPSEVIAFALAPRAALLMGSDDLGNLPRAERVEKIPGSTNRVMAMFHVEHAKIDKYG